MTPESIAAAQLEAINFVERARHLLEAIVENDRFDQASIAFRNHSSFDGNWATFTASRPSSLAKASSALRRQSMELTRALAEMRKP